MIFSKAIPLALKIKLRNISSLKIQKYFLNIEGQHKIRYSDIKRVEMEQSFPAS